MVAFADIVWGASYRWFLFFIIAIVIACIIHSSLRSRKTITHLTHARHQSSLLLHFSWWREHSKIACYIGALIFLTIALLEPQWGVVDQPVMQKGRDIIIALDISRSMLATDFKPSRLEHAKQKIRRLLSFLPAERVGLLLFAGEAFMQCPLTADYSAFDMFLSNVTIESFGSGTTALDHALAKGMSAFIDYEDTSTKLIVLVTDGEDFSTNLSSVTRDLRQKKVVVSALGVASIEGGPIPKIDLHGNAQGYELDEKGRPYVSRLNQSFLEKITRDIGGMYVTSVYDDGDVRAIAEFVESFEKSEHETKEFSSYQAQYPWFIGVCTLLLAISWVL